MSVWKKASKTNQKTHRERHQPESRKHLGLLEKKKDYKARADDHSKKKETLKLLNKRALNKNPDEFYHHMINSKIVDGAHVEKVKEDEHTEEQLKLMESQDLNYIRTKRTMELKKVEKLRSSLHMIGLLPEKGNKTYFFDDEDEKQEYLYNKEKEDEEFAKTHPIVNLREETAAAVKECLKQNYKELVKRGERLKELSIVKDKLETKRNIVQKPGRILPPRRLKKATKNRAAIYEWKYQRKR